MKYQPVFVCALLAVFVSSAFALDCFVCEDKEDGNACGKMGEDFVGSTLNVTTCPEPSKNETGRAVCGKTITEYQAVTDPENKGVIAARFCDIVDYDDQCWTKYGGTTTTYICVCSNEDKCNAAVAISVISLVTVAMGIVATVML